MMQLAILCFKKMLMYVEMILEENHKCTQSDATVETPRREVVAILLVILNPFMLAFNYY